MTEEQKQVTETTDEIDIDIREILYLLLEKVGGKVTVQRSVIEAMRRRERKPKVRFEYLADLDAIQAFTQERFIKEATKSRIVQRSRKLILPGGGN